MSSAWIPPINSLKSTLDRAKPQAGLYIVSTPIGNRADISLRALHTLGTSDLILCEDTRVSKKLLSFYEISTPLLAYHEYNAEKLRPKIINLLKSGQTLSLISDAGTPLISDPGYKLVKTCYEKALYVTTLPGPSAPLAALTLSGLPTDQFVFGGFIPPKSTARLHYFKDYETLKGTLVFFETAVRLLKSLKDMRTILGNRSVCVARELTKKFEEVKRQTLDELIDFYETHGAPKGEIVIVVEGQIIKKEISEAEISQALSNFFRAGHTLKEAVEKVTLDLKVSKKKVYTLALELLK